MLNNHQTTKLERKRILSLKAKNAVKPGNKAVTESTTLTETIFFTSR